MTADEPKDVRHIGGAISVALYLLFLAGIYIWIETTDATILDVDPFWFTVATIAIFGVGLVVEIVDNRDRVSEKYIYD